ncbi:helix-turn-helix transcriptional regulator [Ornithinimicrobium cryptoxanthini]|uniref:WYL domain-containing protein n=1 Tax=Ornithinimicrobium cryptoxanthini TaxID=2934161 RepID=A0ABY4YL71_9MICO|nr:WYL domain-containing protein [Ornithinimicrobium cryptoxanthini]USQ77088.1 WYL domain-containing protein [Ornithinimicrobium cryptoxanthini]
MRSEVSPTARALLALELIQAQPGITADRLADRLGVTPRAARRYVAILREADIPILSTSGPGGGYRLGRGLRLPPLTFSPGEALSLVMAVLDGHHPAADPADTVGSALGKILRALPESVAAQAETVRRTAASAPDRGAARPDPAITATLVRACADHSVVELAYCSESGTQWSTVVEPWAVVVRHGRWYLLCRVVDRDVVRTYRVDRVTSATPGAESFEPPAHLDPVTDLEQHLGAGWEHPTEVVVHGPLELCQRFLGPVAGRLEAIDEQTTRLTGSTSNPAAYAERVLCLPVPFRVVGGPELRAAVREVGERMVAAAQD